MTTAANELREEVRRRYAESALRVTGESEGCGCGSGACCVDGESDGAKFDMRMNGAIIKTVKTTEPARKGLPVIQTATKGGCC